MSDNVSTSVRTEAQQCVALPDQLLSQQLVIFFLFFRQWTGEAVMTRADLSAGIVEGNLPSEEITGSYGSLKVIDPEVLKKFCTLKKRAETVLKDAGVPFCKGFAVPTGEAKDVADRLREIADEFNQERDNLSQQLPQLLTKWRVEHPELNKFVIPDPTDISRRINADFGMTHMTTVSADIDQSQSFAQVAKDDLFSGIIKDVAKRSKDLLKRSVEGHKPEDLSQKTLSQLRFISNKLNTLRFIHHGVAPLCTLVNGLLNIMPTKGKFNQGQFLTLQASLSLLMSEDLLTEVARGKITLEGYLQAFPGTQSLMTGANLFATAPADSRTPVSTEVQESTETVVMEAPVTQETAGQTALEPMFEAMVEPVVEAQTEPTVEAQPEPTSVQPETESVAEATNEDSETTDEFALFAELFGTETAKELSSSSEEVSTATDSDKEAEPEAEIDSNIPPAPTEFFISSF